MKYLLIILIFLSSCASDKFYTSSEKIEPKHQIHNYYCIETHHEFKYNR